MSASGNSNGVFVGPEGPVELNASIVGNSSSTHSKPVGQIRLKFKISPLMHVTYRNDPALQGFLCRKNAKQDGFDSRIHTDSP